MQLLFKKYFVINISFSEKFVNQSTIHKKLGQEKCLLNRVITQVERKQIICVSIRIYLLTGFSCCCCFCLFCFVVTYSGFSKSIFYKIIEVLLFFLKLYLYKCVVAEDWTFKGKSMDLRLLGGGCFNSLFTLFHRGVKVSSK